MIIDLKKNNELYAHPYGTDKIISAKHRHTKKSRSKKETML